MFKIILGWLICSSFMLSISVCSAAAVNHRACAVLIGEADFKTESYTGYLHKFLSKYGIEIGDDIQNLYSNYWLARGEIYEGGVNKEVMLDFAEYSKYDKVLFVVIDSNINEATEVYDFWLGYMGNGSRANVTIKAIFADKGGILKAFTATDDDTSSTSQLRAKRGAFKKCIKKITKDMEPYIDKEIVPSLV